MKHLETLPSKAPFSVIATLFVLSGPGCLFLDSAEKQYPSMDMEMDAGMPTDMDDMTPDMNMDAGMDMNDMTPDMNMDAGMPTDMNDMTPDMNMDAGMPTDMDDMTPDMDPCSATMKNTKDEIINIIDKSRKTLVAGTTVQGSLYSKFNFVCGNVPVSEYERGTDYNQMAMKLENKATISTPNCAGNYTFGDGPQGGRSILEGFQFISSAGEITTIVHGYHPVPTQQTNIPADNAVVLKYKLNYTTGELEKDDRIEFEMCDRLVQEIKNY